MRLDYEQISSTAKAYGWGVIDADDDMVTLDFGITSQIWLFAEGNGMVSAVIVEDGWSYEGGPEWREYEMGALLLPEMLSYLRWQANRASDQWLRMQKEVES